MEDCEPSNVAVVEVNEKPGRIYFKHQDQLLTPYAHRVIIVNCCTYLSV